jgi:hypothetical protein
MIKIRYSSNGSRRSLACYFSCRSGRGFYTIPFPVESHLHSRSASLDGEAMYATRDRATRPSQLFRQRLLLFNPKQQQSKQQHPQSLLPTTLVGKSWRSYHSCRRCYSASCSHFRSSISPQSPLIHLPLTQLLLLLPPLSVGLLSPISQWRPRY